MHVRPSFLIHAAGLLALLTLGACGGCGGGPAATDAAIDGPRFDAAPADAPPSTVNAPPLDPDLPTSFEDATSFLYTGPDAIQTGVTPGAIDPARVVVLRGKTIARDGTPLAGVTITLLGHPELGQTLTRSDGMFDFAANGGGMVTMHYHADAFLLAQRQVQTVVHDYVYLPEVVMVGRDPAVTTITMGAPDMQVARGSMQSDGDGERRATVLFPAGTVGSLVQPDGSTVPAAALDVRMTEYTVGANGPSAMPGTLPATSAYTYAVEMGVDQAVAKVDGRDVVFNQPVYLYVENFLAMPVGEVVPVGYYDPARSVWVGSENGRVIKLLTAAGDLDVTGDDVADTGATLTALGITDVERARIAGLYAPGQTLWRTPMQHFSTYDCNWSVVCEGECKPPTETPPDTCKGKQKTKEGSIIGCDRQTLGEDLDVAGSSLTLHYESDRVPGRTAEANLRVSLGAAGIPPTVLGSEVEVLVAGQKLTQSAPPTMTSASVTWNGKDAYGRPVMGSQPYTVRVGRRFRVVYARGIQVRNSWAALSGIPMTGNYARMDLTLFQEFHGTIRRWNNRAQGLGGWSLSEVHAYDPIAHVLQRGDGTQVETVALGAATIATTAGTGTGGGLGDGGPATQAQMSGPLGIAAGPDGSLYIADNGNLRVRRIAPDGVISTVAGSTFGNSGDGGPATLAQFRAVTDVTVGPDGSVYIADAGSYLVRRVTPDGIIHPFAGNGVVTYSGDGGPATSAGMEPYGLAVSPDGSIYVADRSNARVRVIDQTGVINTFAGSAASGSTGDGGPATDARLAGPTGLALGPDGSLFIMDRSGARVRKVSPTGIITTVAGNGTYGAGGDGGPAELAQLATPSHVAVTADGTLYIADYGNNRVRAVGSEGVISTAAGLGTFGFGGDGGLAPGALLAGPSGITVGPDDQIYVTDFYNNRVRRLGSALPGGSASEKIIPSSDGGEIYVFSGAGRHLRTLDALTGAVLAELAYDANGLASIDDGDGNLTTVERDASGRPTAIVAPHGVRTALGVDANGFLASVADPAGAAITLGSDATGLLTTLTDRRGGIHRFGYDPLGRLIRDEDPAGGVQTVTRTETVTGSTIAVATNLGRVTTYALGTTAGGPSVHITTEPGGLVTESLRYPSGSLTVTRPDGMIDAIVPGPDPRFGMLVPLTAGFTAATPAGLARVVTGTRTATLTSTNPLDLATLTQTQTVDGHVWTHAFDRATRTMTETSPLGRTRVTTLDARGRVVSQQTAGLALHTFGYDAEGRSSTISAGAGPTLRTRSFTYDASGRLASELDQLGQTTTYAYDAAGYLVQITGPDGATTTRTTVFGRDASGNITSLTPPGQAAHTFTYDPGDLGTGYHAPAAPASSGITTVARDADRRLDLVTFPDGTGVDVGYDAAGRLATLAIPRGTISYAYDAAGRVQSITDPGTEVASFGYDGRLLLTNTVAGPVAGSVGRTYDTGYRLATVRVNGANPVTFTYDNDDLLVGAGALTIARSPSTGFVTGTTLGVVTEAWTYNVHGEPLTYTASTSGTPQLQETYVRDAAGRVTQRTETILGATTVYTYAYDRAGRLTGVDVGGAPYEIYTYNANGNRLSASVGGASRTATYDAQDRLATDGTTTFQYTAWGHLAGKTAVAGTTTYSSDQLGAMLGATLPGGLAITYVVDGRGLRIGKRVAGTLVQGFLYEGPLRPVAELNAAGTVVSRFVYGLRDNVPAYVVKAGVTYRILTDEVGSPRLVVNTATGAIAQRMDYDAYGNVTADTSPGFQPFGFAGGLYDRDTRLVRFGAREYDPQAGRWIAKDPLLFAAGDPNLYAYASGDPVNARDPTGLEDIDAPCSAFCGKSPTLPPPSDGLMPKGPGQPDFTPDQPKQFQPPTPPSDAPAACTPLGFKDKVKNTVGYWAWNGPPSLKQLDNKGRDRILNFMKKQGKDVKSDFEKRSDDFDKSHPYTPIVPAINFPTPSSL